MPTEWDVFLQRHPEAHILQTSTWGQLKSVFGWFALSVQAPDCGAQILFRRLPLGLTFAYIPKGPVGSGWQQLWPAIDRACRQRRAVFLKVEPDCDTGAAPEDGEDFSGFTPAASIQPRRTVVVDLHGSEEDWLERMKQKTRYNIRLAERKGVVVRPSEDMESFQRLMEITGRRDGFGVHASAYYRRAYELFAKDRRCALLAAEFEGRPLAAIMVFASGRRAWYFYGASSDEERSRMPTYLLQWEAMRWAARRGCTEYDLWGIPDAEEDELESQFTGRSDGLWGVYRFKRGFGGRVVRSPGAWDRIYAPRLYAIYRWWMKRRGGEAE
jgi:peptidoglycan pentaglycine glycine transferase (the first glycine)